MQTDLYRTFRGLPEGSPFFVTFFCWKSLALDYEFAFKRCIIQFEEIYIQEVPALNEVLNTISSMFWNMTHRAGFADLVDIIVVAVIIYAILKLTRHTRGSALIKGFIVLLIVSAASSLLGLTALNWLLMTVLNNGAIVLVILFQPEIRKALEQMGNTTLFSGKRSKQAASGNSRLIDEIVQTMTDLSERKVGALIVFEQRTGLNDVIATGTLINGRISAPLLENIFEPNTPLHDGAVVIQGENVTAAACIIHTLTESTGVSRALGTRHRAGIGITENTDAVVLIVSEETGVMSIARGGELTRNLDESTLREVLCELYQDDSKFTLLNFIRNLRKGKEEAE